MKLFKARWKLVAYDMIVLFWVAFVLLFLYQGNESLSISAALWHTCVSAICIFTVRFAGSIYQRTPESEYRRAFRNPVASGRYQHRHPRG